MPSLQDLTERVADAAMRNPVSRPVTLDLGETGLIHVVDGRTSHQDAASDCRISLSADDLEALMDGHLDATMAYMTGQLRVDGDITLALQLASAVRR